MDLLIGLVAALTVAAQYPYWSRKVIAPVGTRLYGPAVRARASWASDTSLITTALGTAITMAVLDQSRVLGLVFIPICLISFRRIYNVRLNDAALNVYPDFALWHWAGRYKSLSFVSEILTPAMVIQVALVLTIVIS